MALDHHDAVGQEQLELFLADEADLHQEAVLEIDPLGDLRALDPAHDLASLVHRTRRQEAVRLVLTRAGEGFAVRACLLADALSEGRRARLAEYLVEITSGQGEPPGWGLSV